MAKTHFLIISIILSNEKFYENYHYFCVSNKNDVYFIL